MWAPVMARILARGLKRWKQRPGWYTRLVKGHDIYHTRSEVLVPQTNGAAERGVRWLKTMAKVLLAEAKVELQYWTLAMHMRLTDASMSSLGWASRGCRLLPFGSKDERCLATIRSTTSPIVRRASTWGCRIPLKQEQ